MSDQIKGGKKPLSSKSDFSLDSAPENDIFYLPQEFKDLMAERGFEVRFLDAKTLMESGGYHRSGWQAYKLQEEDKKYIQGASSGFKLGNDPDGIVRRLSTILGYRPIEMGDKHRARLETRAARYRGDTMKSHAQGMKQAFEEAGISAKNVIVGDDE